MPHCRKESCRYVGAQCNGVTSLQADPIFSDRKAFLDSANVNFLCGRVTLRIWIKVQISLATVWLSPRGPKSNKQNKNFIISVQYLWKPVLVPRSGDTIAQVQLFLTEKHLSIWQMSTFPVRNARKVVVNSENSDFWLLHNTKGQVISERNLGFLNFPKQIKKLFKDFCPSL